jgi:Ca2+-binding RTX toxin-like protein
VKILFVSFNPHFTIGYLKPPPDYQLATLNAGGALTLNVGPNAGNRNVGQGQTGETVGITESGTGIFTVSDFGVSETCGSPSDPVTSINGNFTGDGNNVVVFSAPAGVTGSVPVNLTMNDNANLQGGDIAILDNVKVGDNSTVQGVGSLGTEITAGALAQVTLTGWSGPSSTTGSPTVVTGGNSTIDLRLAGSGFGVTTGGGTVYGTPYTDTIDTTGGGMIYGEGGSDSVTFSGGGNGLIDLRGNDTEGQLIDASGSTGNVTIYGGGGNNTIKGGSGSDTIYTGNGNNIVYDDNGDQSV